MVVCFSPSHLHQFHNDIDEKNTGYNETQGAYALPRPPESQSDRVSAMCRQEEPTPRTGTIDPPCHTTSFQKTIAANSGSLGKSAHNCLVRLPLLFSLRACVRDVCPRLCL